MSLEVSIKKSFGDFKLDVDFSAESETLGFLGPSGCGKSLTFRCIAGIETPDEGRIVVNDTVFFDSEKNIDLSAQERKTALLFQSYMLFPNLTVEQNIASGAEADVPKDERKVLVDSEIKRFGLTGLEKRYPAQLSGGQQQRVALARMLAARPGILMLDEPFSALDSHLKGFLEQSLTNLFSAFKGTILYISHDIDEAFRFCDTIIVVDNGKIVERGDGPSIVNDPQSLAAIRLSGCKNITETVFVDTHTVRLPAWGVEVCSKKELCPEITHMGVHSTYIERAEEPGENVYRVRVDRVSDSRFERVLLLGVLDRAGYAQEAIEVQEDEISFLAQHIFWTVDKNGIHEKDLPFFGEELLIHIPKDKIYFTGN